MDKTKVCPDCKGKAIVNVDGVFYECKTCKGTGRVSTDKSEGNEKNESQKVRLND